MRGHDDLIDLRRTRRQPLRVDIDADGDSILSRLWRQENPHHACLSIEPGENLGRLDLRCLVGLPVFVNGSDSERVAAIVQACTEANARRVIGNVCERTRHGLEVARIIDSEGVLTWPN